MYVQVHKPEREQAKLRVTAAPEMYVATMSGTTHVIAVAERQPINVQLLSLVNKVQAEVVRVQAMYVQVQTPKEVLPDQ